MNLGKFILKIFSIQSRAFDHLGIAHLSNIYCALIFGKYLLGFILKVSLRDSKAGCWGNGLTMSPPTMSKTFGKLGEVEIE